MLGNSIISDIVKSTIWPTVKYPARANAFFALTLKLVLTMPHSKSYSHITFAGVSSEDKFTGVPELDFIQQIKALISSTLLRPILRMDSKSSSVMSIIDLIVVFPLRIKQFFDRTDNVVSNIDKSRFTVLAVVSSILESYS